MGHAVTLALTVTIERFPIAGRFTISRGSRTEAVVVVATLSDGRFSGRGECVPYARYGETVEGVVADIEKIGSGIANGSVTHATLANALPAGAARNAVDCAFWDFAAKATGVPAHKAAGLESLAVLITCYTLSLGTPEAMAATASAASARPLLKVKLGGDGDLERIAAVRAAAPNATLVVDANEAWTPDTLVANIEACRAAGVALIEQPLPAGNDEALSTIARPIPICADESLHTASDLHRLSDRYDAVNIKLDKAGGLTAALTIANTARQLGYKIMVGCMVGTSLAMAPAVIAAQGADFVDLDGPLLLARDRESGLRFDGSTLYPPDAALWG